MLRALVLGLLLLPVTAGALGVLAPAFGIFPALGYRSVSLAPFADLLAVPGLTRAVGLSASVGLLATGTSVVGAGLIAGVLAQGRWLNRMARWLSPILAIPHASVAYGVMFLIAPSGIVARLIAPLVGWERPPDLLIVNDPAGLALVFALVCKEVPFLLLMILAALPQVPVRALGIAAGGLGADRLSAWWYVIWPNLYRQIRLPIFLVLAYSMTVVDVALIIGPTVPPTLSVLTVQWMSDPDLSLRMRGAAAAILQSGLVLGAILFWIGLERGLRALGVRAIEQRVRPQLNTLRPIGWFAAGIIGATVITGLVMAAEWSMTQSWMWPDLWPRAGTLGHWQRFAADRDILAETLILALGAATLAVGLALALLERQEDLPNWALYLPLIAPQVAFLPGLQVMMLTFGLRQGIAPVFAAHLVFVFPYVWLTLAGPYRAWDRRFDAVAAGLGAGPWRRFWIVRGPMVLAAILKAWAIGAAVSIGQYLPTLLIGGGRVTTLTTEAVAFAAGGDRRLIGVMTVAQTFAALMPIVIAITVPRRLFRNRRGMLHG